MRRAQLLGEPAWSDAKLPELAARRLVPGETTLTILAPGPYTLPILGDGTDVSATAPVTVTEGGQATVPI